MSGTGTRLPRAALELAVLGLLAALLANPARADEPEEINAVIARARIAEQELEYEKATSLWLTVILRSDATSEQLISANLNAGRLSRLLEREQEARAHFIYVLQHDPERQLPPNDPPRVREYFEQLRAEVHQQRAPDPSNAVATTPPATTAPPTTTAPATTAASAGDEGGTLLLVGGGTSAAVGVLGLGLGGVMGLMSADANQQAEASEVQIERGERFADRDLYATIANVGFAGGGLLVLAGAGVLGYALLVDGE